MLVGYDGAEEVDWFFLRDWRPVVWTFVVVRDTLGRNGLIMGL
jgi:hypothetical protein